MTINPSEVTKLLKDQIKNFGEKTGFRNRQSIVSWRWNCESLRVR